MASDRPSPVGVDPVAGFSGSGKTTFIRTAAEALWADVPTLFLENERGHASLSGLNGRPGWTAEALEGGCICCTGSALLQQALLRLTERDRPRRIVLELAGTAGLRDVKDLFSQLGDRRWRIEHMVLLVRASDFLRRWDLSRPFLERQIAASPAVVLTDPASVPRDTLAEIRRTILDFKPRCALYPCDLSALSGEEVLALYDRSRALKELAFHP